VTTSAIRGTIDEMMLGNSLWPFFLRCRIGAGVGSGKGEGFASGVELTKIGNCDIIHIRKRFMVKQGEVGVIVDP
jgi:hypothetical protein